MTALDDRPRATAPGDWWEWHGFVDGLAHLYQHTQLALDWPPLVYPACEQHRSVPFGHDRPSVTPHPVRTHPDRVCPGCLSQTGPTAPEVPRARR
ncbi:hypothetical protein DMA12_24460 [Amycolatopsis balhimycina DSM 5908]|uniref:Uncharacterized protein n=1 Tax=Amycolatopsis balhimycina DSM 5908 TaxID=1081091 RepID=A0A428WEF2_AMYBA|nr:hypothetical protein [Amycolatopsis balhimycina]RSM41474.1 hypothetical protein DMA12_24460 [Amycolatopsis balhimycina DSM 5908]